MENKPCRGLAAILLAGILWGTMSPVGKALAGLGTDMFTVPLAVVIFFSHSLLTALGAAFVTRESPRPVHIAAAVLTLLGVAIAIFPGFWLFPHKLPCGFPICSLTEGPYPE
jgi:drug/metabolite transporter (DMT)-like permease